LEGQVFLTEIVVERVGCPVVKATRDYCSIVIEDTDHSWSDGDHALSVFEARGPEEELDGFVEELAGKGCSEDDVIEGFDLVMSRDGKALFKIKCRCLNKCVKKSLFEVNQVPAALSIEGGEARVSILVSEEEFGDLVQDLKEVLDGFRLDGVTEIDDGVEKDYLTERQRDILENSLQKGYFDNPRKSSLKEVAEDMGISSATASEHLRVGLSKVLSRKL